MVLDALASYVGHMLTQVAADELGMLLGVSSEIDKMDDKLRDLKNFLADADRRNITDESVQEWVGLLKRAMYEATDILDLCQLKAMDNRPSKNVGAGCFNPLLFCMRNPSHAREIGTRIKALNKRLDNIKQRSAAFSFINLGSYEDRRKNNVQASNSNRETSPDLDCSAVVGEKIEEDTRSLVAQIMQTEKEVNNNIMVVAIVGVGGIGKTTLAQKVFNDNIIQGEFSKKIWLSVNQNFSDAELLRTVITEAGGDHRPAGNTKVALHRTLKDALTGHKTFLVMDDVWDHRAWEGVLKIPLGNAVASGSRVLVTTRDEGVAKGMRATWPYHHVDTLALDDAWSLLKKQVLSSELDEDHIDSLKDIGLKIIQKCGGLPLAIKVMGGLLRKRGELRRDWEQVLGDSKWSITEMPPELNYAVCLSYEDMPPYLKQCFLHYSLLSKKLMFDMYQVVAMWISEGFIHGNSNDLEVLGEHYYNELVSRNLLEQYKSFSGNLFCRMHDVVRSFAQYMTKDEALLAHDGDADILTRLHSQKFLRLSIESNGLPSGQFDWETLKEQQSLRTLISTIQIKMKPGDSLVRFSSLRILHVVFTDVGSLIESLHRLKHLRYLTLVNTGMSVLPWSIGKMKLLQFLDVYGCEDLVNLPGSILKLGQLRTLKFSREIMIPRGLHGLANVRTLADFRAYMDDNWCSLDELGPLSQLQHLQLHELETLSSASSAANAKLGGKVHLTKLVLHCTSRHEGFSKEEQQRIVKVFDELCPPPSLENLDIRGYFGQQLPSWMMSESVVPLTNLKTLLFSDLACCTYLPNGLCQLPYLQFLQVWGAPCIRCVGTGFMQAAETPFPRLNTMCLRGMVEWEEWDWEDQVQAMPRLEELVLSMCKLRCVPPGLASNARALKVLCIDHVHHLSYLENFPFVANLQVVGSPNLERITNLPNLQKLTIKKCPKLKVLESIPALESFVLEDYTMLRLPEYMREINPRNLHLSCRIVLVILLSDGQSSIEWDKFGHVDQVKAYAPNGLYVLYTRDNYKLDSNIGSSLGFEENLSSSMVDVQGFEHVYKMRRSTFSYVCKLVRIRFIEDMVAMDHTFIDGRVLSLQDRVAIALRMLSSGEPPKIVGSCVGVEKLPTSLVTKAFVEAGAEKARWHDSRWPYSTSKMEKIKRKFDKIHGLPNCCGVVHTAHIKFRSQKYYDVVSDGVQLQVLVDPDMRLTDICVSASMTKLSIFHGSRIFKECENGIALNGRKLKLSDGLDVGEYFIGDAGYPVRPWLLTPYQLENDLPDYKKEFNKRHSAATAVAQRALARLKETWKCLQGEGWHSNNAFDKLEIYQMIDTCCLLHNIMIDKEEVAGMADEEEGVVEEEEEGVAGMEDKEKEEEEEQEKEVAGMEDEEVAGMEDEEEEEEEEDVLGMEEDKEDENYINQVRQIADEDGVQVRDALSLHLIESRVRAMAEENEEVVPVASGSGDQNKEQEAFQRQKVDRGKDKVPDC